MDMSIWPKLKLASKLKDRVKCISRDVRVVKGEDNLMVMERGGDVNGGGGEV